MSLYDKVEYIKDFFRPKTSVVYPNTSAIQDAAMLKEMQHFSGYIHASNRHNYWYYVPYNDDDLDLARFLLERNGLRMRKHLTHMDYQERYSLRMRARDVRGDNRLSEFVKLIADAKKTYSDMTDVMDKVRSEMKAKSK